MKRIIKCGTAFLLALVLCLCLLPTTAFAASKQVYIWNFPLSDDTLKSSGNWGHGVLNLRFGYRVGASSYTQFRCLDSWQGEVAYCIEPGAPQKNYDSITDHDDMDLYTLGEKKCALYAVIPDNDNTYNFLVSLLYSQVFQTLYYCADQIHHGPLPRHVHFILDEAPSVNLPGLPRELATMRSRNISCSTIIQNMAQIKEQFKDSWETIPGNSDTLLYLGGNESSTHKYISEALGKSTIDTKTHGETKGKSGSWSTNMQISGRELLTPDEVRRLDNRYAILLIRGAGPVMDLKYDLMKHPAVRQTSLAGGPPYIHHRQNQAPVISGHEFFAAFSTDDTNENKENAA